MKEVISLSKPRKDFVLRDVKPAQPLSFDYKKCTGCNICVDLCPSELLLPNLHSGLAPSVAYPEECWYCGCCVMDCPNGAVTLQHPLMNRVRWVEKASLLKKEDE